MEGTYLKLFFLITLLYHGSSCNQDGAVNIEKLFEKINDNLLEYNAVAADISWGSTVNPDNPELPDRAARYEKDRISWQHGTCDLLKQLERDHLLNGTQRRQTYLLCRGAKWLIPEAREVSSIYDDLQNIYSGSKICISAANSTAQMSTAQRAILDYLKRSKSGDITANNGTNKRSFENGMCLQGENDFENLMRSRNADVSEWTWLAWREIVGPTMREPYTRLVRLENRASQRNGYSDIGEVWRDELETTDLRLYARRLYSEVRPLYVALHGIVRYFLRELYGETVPERGPIPAHLLGDLWSQNWGDLVDVVLPEARGHDLDHSIRNTNWSVLDMVRKADDFYTSLSLPPMTEQFWRRSVLERGGARCHGTAADMFRSGDFRMLYCAEVKMEDFYVIHHEMGHIQYYMAYEEQPAIFREGTNSAFHETIGDAIMYGVMCPQHLHRLGLINDTLLFDEPDKEQTENVRNIDVKDFVKFVQLKERSFKSKTKKERKGSLIHSKVNLTFDEIHLFKQALTKIPQIPFSLMLDEYRWALFEGQFDGTAYNRGFWKLVRELQGVAPPRFEDRGERYFDAGAKFHVPDNTPYIRYFLSSFLQTQVFRSLCRATVLGPAHAHARLPRYLRLHRCDVYGSKQAGRLLRRMLSKGASIHWREALELLTGEREIRSEALLQYYQPLYPLLLRLIETHDIPIGW